jgi:hypothetical protein
MSPARSAVVSVAVLLPLALAAVMIGYDFFRSDAWRDLLTRERAKEDGKSSVELGLSTAGGPPKIVPTFPRALSARLTRRAFHTATAAATTDVGDDSLEGGTMAVVPGARSTDTLRPDARSSDSLSPTTPRRTIQVNRIRAAARGSVLAASGPGLSALRRQPRQHGQRRGHGRPSRTRSPKQLALKQPQGSGHPARRPGRYGFFGLGAVVAHRCRQRLHAGQGRRGRAAEHWRLGELDRCRARTRCCRSTGAPEQPA